MWRVIEVQCPACNVGPFEPCVDEPVEPHPSIWAVQPGSADAFMRPPHPERVDAAAVLSAGG